ncbi:glycoside hydrolase [Ceratobasidium sp. AG-I]|nr:glycoside hydrolase [Ceratobasidium sp. AG-I]
MLVSSATATQTLVAALSLQQASYKPAPNVSLSDVNTTDIFTSGVGGNLTSYATNLATDDVNTVTAQSRGCDVEDYDPPDVPVPTFAPYDEKKASFFRYRKQLSVNLGSWFVQENWMNPSLFKCASGPKAAELDVATGWGDSKSSRSLLEKHWDTWITEDDFAWLQQTGVNTVRIPIGYWSLGRDYCQGTPFEQVANVYDRSWPRILRAISWAEKYDIGVLVDLHGAPGSQNGQAHSGTSNGQSHLFDDEGNIKRTIDILTYLTKQLVPVSNVVGIQVLNEPNNVVSLPDFYGRVIDTLRKVSPEAAKFPFYIHDGFNLQRFADFVSGRRDFVVQDHHSYFVFTPSDSAKPAAEHISSVDTAVLSALSSASKKARHNIVVDEWSCALTPQSLSFVSSGAKQLAARKSFCSQQVSVYLRSTAGWSFWSYKTENCDNEDGWCFRKAVGRSLPSKFSSWDGMDGVVGASNVGEDEEDEDESLFEDQIVAVSNRPTIHAQVSHPASGTSPEITLNDYPTGQDDTVPIRVAANSHPDPTNLLAQSDPTSPGTAFEEPHRSAKDPAYDLPNLITQSGPPAPNADDMFAASILPDAGPTFHAVSLPNSGIFKRVFGLRAVGSGTTAARRAAREEPVEVEARGEKKKSGGKKAGATETDKGYEDGHAAAIAFGDFGGSRLGFATQYMEDGITVLVTSKALQPDKKDAYRKSFVKGLADGERKVIEKLKQ